jgi:hypothetical protein
MAITSSMHSLTSPFPITSKVKVPPNSTYQKNQPKLHHFSKKGHASSSSETMEKYTDKES